MQWILYHYSTREAPISFLLELQNKTTISLMNTEAEILNNIINSKLSPMIHKKDFKKGKKQTKFCQLTHTSVRGSTRKRPLKDSRGRLWAGGGSAGARRTTATLSSIRGIPAPDRPRSCWVHSPKASAQITWQAPTQMGIQPFQTQGCGRAEGWATEALEVCKKWQWAERAPCSHSDRCQAHSSAPWTLGLIVFGCK